MSCAEADAEAEGERETERERGKRKEGGQKSEVRFDPVVHCGFVSRLDSNVCTCSIEREREREEQRVINQNSLHLLTTQ